MSANLDPLVAPPPADVPLTDAPLVRVIAQLRFPEILSVEKGEFVAPFQEAIRATYPVLREEQTQVFAFGAAVAAPAKPRIIWRFADSAGQWRVSLAPDFLALETTRYASRADFFGRLHAVAVALDDHVDPGQVDRLGVRYINRVAGSAVDDIASLVRPEVRGIVGTEAATHAVHTLTETLFERDGARVQCRWGCLPAGATIDPAAIEPAPENSWVLDIDTFSVAPMPFVPDQVVGHAQRYAERIYTIFRWAVTDDFLARHGGQP